MTPISSIYISRIDCSFSARFIADVFDKNGIAKVSRVYIKPNRGYKTKYNRVYIGIKTWHETEAAYNFISRLRNPSREARIIYSGDKWWPVNIDKYPITLAPRKHLTIFEYNLSNMVSKDPVKIDAKKKQSLRNIITNFNKKTDNNRINWKFLEHPDNNMVDFDDYFREAETEREKWYSEQYIYDYLNM